MPHLPTTPEGPGPPARRKKRKHKIDLPFGSTAPLRSAWRARRAAKRPKKGRDPKGGRPHIQYFFGVACVFRNETAPLHHQHKSISGLVVECIVAIDVTRVRFPADAWAGEVGHCFKVSTD